MRPKANPIPGMASYETPGSHVGPGRSPLRRACPGPVRHRKRRGNSAEPCFRGLHAVQDRSRHPAPGQHQNALTTNATAFVMGCRPIPARRFTRHVVPFHASHPGACPVLHCRQLSQNFARQVDWLSAATPEKRYLVRTGARVDNRSRVEPLLDPVAISLESFIGEGAFD